MKTRTGFVSNSSSSSFVLLLEHISIAQLEMLQNHVSTADRLCPELSMGEHNAWDIRVDALTVRGFTWLDNFDMQAFMEVIGIDTNLVEWDSEN